MSEDNTLTAEVSSENNSYVTLTGDVTSTYAGKSYYPSPAFSLNNRVIVEPYISDRAIKTKEVNGFATIVQKVSLKGLKVLVEARVNDGKQTCSVIQKGDTVYIKEELLHTQPFARNVMECDAVEGKFIIVDLAHVDFVVPK